MRSKYFLNIIFDCDSTLTEIEGLDEIARRKGIFDRISELTQQGMNGEIPYRVSFQAHVVLYKTSTSQKE